MFDDTTTRELKTSEREKAVNLAYNRITGNTDEDWGPDLTLDALNDLFDAALASRPAPAEIALPTEPRRYSGKRGSIWELDVHGNWWFRGYPGRTHPTPSQQDRTESDVRTYGMPLNPIPAPVGEVEREEVRDALRWMCHTVGFNADGELDGDILADAILSEFTVSRKVVS